MAQQEKAHKFKNVSPVPDLGCLFSSCWLGGPKTLQVTAIALGYLPELDGRTL